MLLPPRELPERVKNIELQQINLDLENAITTHSATPLQYTDAQVNDYLVNVVKNKHAALSKFLEFERAFVKFDEGVCRITAERSLLGFSVFHAISYKVTLQNGTLTTSTNGGSIGRMPIHPMIMKYGDILFTDLWAALDRDKKTVSKMAAIEFHPKTVILNAKSRPGRGATPRRVRAATPAVYAPARRVASIILAETYARPIVASNLRSIWPSTRRPCARSYERMALRVPWPMTPSIVPR